MKIVFLFLISIIFFNAHTAFAATRARNVIASGGDDCFKSLDAKDLDDLGSIIDIGEDVAGSLTPEKERDFNEEKIAIEKKFTGIKRQAALALLSFSVAQANQAAMRRVMNQVMYKRSSKLDEADEKNLEGLISEAKQNGYNLEDALNMRVNSLSVSASLLRSKGALLNAKGEWSFSDQFDFSEIKNNPDLKNALSDFFPEEVKDLSQNWRAYARIGNRVITNIPDTTQKLGEQPIRWVWKSEDLEAHTKKMLEILNRFSIKAEEFARLAKENSHWVKITGAALDKDLCEACIGFTMRQVLEGPVIGLVDHIYKINHESNWDKWNRKLDEQLKVQKELEAIQIELTLEGASDETKKAMREGLARIQNTSDKEMEEGLLGMKRAMMAIVFSPAAVAGGVEIAGGAGVALLTGSGSAAPLTLGTGIAIVGTGVTAITLATPVMMATRNYYKAVKNGDGKLCSMVKYGANIPVRFVETLRWGAMMPVLRTVAPVVAPVTDPILKNINRLGPLASKIVLIIPGLTLSGWGLTSSTKSLLTKNEAIHNIEAALKNAKENHDERGVSVLEEMLQCAKEEKWNQVVSIANSFMMVLSTVSDMTMHNEAVTIPSPVQ